MTCSNNPDADIHPPSPDDGPNPVPPTPPQAAVTPPSRPEPSSPVTPEVGSHSTHPTTETHAFFAETRTQDTQGFDSEPRLCPVLVVLEGKGAGEQHLLRKDLTLLGREMDVDLVLKDGRVSRNHACIHWRNMDRPTEEPQCLIEDLGSRNGVIVNGQRVQCQALRDGDRILIGGILVGFYVKDEQELSFEQRLLSMATTDGLTGLANRTFFESEARKEIDRAHRYGRPLSIQIIDLDHFKQVNDTYGHPGGDTVLRQLARLLLVTVRQDDILGRLGGEEFAVLLPETPLVGAVRSAERIRERVEKHMFQHKAEEIHVTVSVGVAEYLPRYQSRAEFFEAADKALYRAKDSGRNRVCAAENPVRADGEMPTEGMGKR